MSLIKGRWARGLRVWTAWATSSFPVPVSPWIITVEAERAAAWMEAFSAWIRTPLPTMFAMEYFAPCRAISSFRTSFRACRASSSLEEKPISSSVPRREMVVKQPMSVSPR